MFGKYPKYKFILAFCDFLLFVGAWLGAILIRFSDVPFSELIAHPIAELQLVFVAGYSLVWVVIFQHFHLYKLNLFLSVSDQITAIVKGIIYGLVGLIFVSFFIKGMDWIDSRAVLALFILISFVSITLFRTVFFRQLFVWASQKKILRHRVLIIGSDQNAQMIATRITFDDSHGLEIQDRRENRITSGIVVVRRRGGRTQHH